ncbi:hypothetical protein M758_9G120700 [Ceratodon purpureus]|uniref:Uncharacterized protein n=1 Tax=Ceratodon purpureus TaxID=3225 RepID=A0A8T0GQQ9_CERPU|nr:hypothetical protein KC19_9G105800 [Ceratodon purpureus]KAG0606185.1 hypothetical protein M758_9G120700 [Ceratodon purpureus]
MVHTRFEIMLHVTTVVLWQSLLVSPQASCNFRFSCIMLLIAHEENSSFRSSNILEL